MALAVDIHLAAWRRAGPGTRLAIKMSDPANALGGGSGSRANHLGHGPFVDLPQRLKLLASTFLEGGKVEVGPFGMRGRC